MKITYKQKLFFCFVVIFALFTAGILVFERSRDRMFRTGALQEKLDAYADIISLSIGMNAGRQPGAAIDAARAMLPRDLRVTLITGQGEVVYDNAAGPAGRLENHAGRPEIMQALKNGSGADIRLSASNGLKYIYYAKRFTDYFVRVAFPYDTRIRHFLQPDNRFLYFIAVLFLLMLALTNFVAGRFGKSIKQLRGFAVSAGNGGTIADIDFPDDELGEIGAKIRESYELINRNKRKISLEREKLLQHVHVSGEGLCFFSHDRKVKFHNGLFIRYLNFLTDESTSDPLTIFTEPKFGEVAAFLSGAPGRENYFETRISCQGRFFSIQVNLFEDRSFEIIINDTTRQEKTRRLKQEMTGNIAHELRTPITSIRGYLELILSQSPDAATARTFTEKAYGQTLVLSELIRDMSLISKIGEAPRSFQLEAVNLNELLRSLENDLQNDLRRENIRMKCDLGGDIVVNGNPNLLYSVFRNLTDNVIRHAGGNIDILVCKCGEDGDFYYFTYADTGAGIPDEQHLNRLFERFYRVDGGRTRDTGGSGLGLSIVKNAILLHRGNIVVKNRTGGGLKFIFNLPKQRVPQE
ncbi:MAG: two-component sensor histidine kinase [Tannerella sp.]|jgi:signal transduction histidine kinase|nr:two-component sensor histidine kinase [Tannerella sp.]